MPELPEVETVVRTLRPSVVGATVRGVGLHRADILDPPGTDLSARLMGRSVKEITRRGKKIIFLLDDGNRFYIHLGMTGQLTVEAMDAPVKSHTHLTLDVQPAGEGKAASLAATALIVQVRFRDYRRFGGVWWLGADEPADAGMGPEPFGVTPAQLGRRLAKTKRAVKSALLDQSIIAGLGNIYVDESLFSAGIHPLTPANSLSVEQARRLNRAIKTTLRKAIRHRGSTLRDYRDASGAAGGFQNQHKVYDRAGKPCPGCKRPIERIVLGGRSTHFCPNCQPAGKR